MKTQIVFLLAAISLTGSALARAQSAPALVPSNSAHYRAEIAVDYAYLHTNAPPGGCGCFSMNGFSVQTSFPVDRKGFSMVGDLSVEDKSNAAGTSTSLTLGSFSAGIRYHLKRGGWMPFGEVLAGGIQATGGFSKIGVTSPASASLSFAGTVGGGLDRIITPRWSLRMVEADYFATTFDNGSNNHQNNFRVTAGLAFHF